MTFVRMAFFPSGTARHYANVARALQGAPEPAERLAFLAGPCRGGWQVVQVWSSKDALDAFNATWFRPALDEVGAQGFPAPPVVHDFEAQDVQFSPPPPDGRHQPSSR